MTDEAMFEHRLAGALARYADLAPTMDDELLARTAVAAGGPRRFGRLGQLVDTFLGDDAAGPRMHVVYVLLLAALLVAALLVAVVGGFVHFQSPIIPGHNGSIVYSYGPNGHAAVQSVEIDANGQGNHQIDAGRCPVYSRDGSALAWMSYQDAGAMLLVAGAGGAPPRETLLVQSPERSVPFDVSPDASRVAWLKPTTTDPTSTELWVAPTDGGAGELIVAAPARSDESYGSLSWAPDGRSIAFATYRKDSTTGQPRRTAIEVVAVDGTGRRTVTTRPGPDDVLAWSPDSRNVAYIGSADGADPSTAELFVVGIDGAADRAVTSLSAQVRGPAWSPDGGYLGFLVSGDGPGARLATVPVDSAVGVPPASGPIGEWFVWSPDGTEVLSAEVVAVDARTNRTTLFSIDRELRGPPVTRQVVDGLIVCTPTWQRVGG